MHTTERPLTGRSEGEPGTVPGRLEPIPSIPPGVDTGSPQPDAAELADWLKLLYGRCPADLVLAGSMIGRTGANAGKLRPRAFRTVADLDRLAGELATTAERADVYVSCCPLSHRPSKGRGRAADAAALPALFGDLDYDVPGHSPPANGLPLPPTAAEALDAVATLPPPSVVVHSGGGLQPWWLLDEPLLIDDDNRAEVAELVDGWGRAVVAAGAAKGWHVDNVADLARILRPVGTVNRKPSRPPAPVAIVRGEGCGELYTLDQLTPYLLAAPERPPRPATPRPGTLGQLTPADAFDLATWADILAPHGWTYAGPDVIDGAPVELWRRPDAESPYSAKCFPDGPAVIWSSAVATAPGESWSKFRTWAELAHGGDMAAAARAARTESRGGRR